MISSSARPDDGSMSLIEHLTELRRRLIISVAALLITATACFSFAPQLFSIMQRPLAGISAQQMVVLSPLEMFITYLKLAVLAGLFFAMPVILWQVWLFVAPGLYANEKRWILPFVILGSVFFVGGGLFAFYVVLPMGFEYLVAMVPESVSVTYSVEIYFSLVIRLILAFALVFELPLIMWVLAAAGIVQASTFSGLRRYWIVIAFILGAILTPPDPLSQALMAVPLILFFELGILGARLLARRQAKAS